MKRKIQTAIKTFSMENALQLFSTLGYNTERHNSFENKDYAEFKDNFGELFSEKKFYEDKALVDDWNYVDMLFQLTQEEVANQHVLFNTNSVDNTIMESYLFFAIDLKQSDYSRTHLANITREINKLFNMPVMVVFKHGQNITMSVINRRLHKKDSQKDVLEKVTLIKDISTVQPHRAHIEILFDLSFAELRRVHKVNNFVELHNAWQKVLDTKELNKRFYRELSNWYFWAIHEVNFPNASTAADKTGLFNDEDRVREHSAKNLIRLLTRILFVWFIKEKNLIPEELFDESYISEHLIDGFEPRKDSTLHQGTQGSKYYRAILQNLFFATLNQTVGKREFRKDGQQMNVTNLMRYESYFKNPQEFLNLVESVVPFMNGGLFECLDTPDPVLKGKKGGDVIIYEDGFSDRKDNPLCVPDYIFFGKGEHADLSVELGDKKQKNVEVKGLINILKSYKFTVTENTPIEEDIALDPELLGRVFENLLASYNPETKTTARKQTGSFYTPREIVDYMVNESLIAYLATSPPNPLSKGEGGNGNERWYMTTKPDTYKVLKPFALENRKNQTQAESILWENIRNNKLGVKFRRQHPIDRFIVDFVSLPQKLIIEIDGEYHLEKEQQDYDRARTALLNQLGYREIRFTNEEILNSLQKVLTTIKNTINSSSFPSPLERGQGVRLEEASSNETRLRELLSYSEAPNPFNEEETKILISAIDNCKILDPACGSGAFPMGILHKLVHILHKLDPQNKLWKERQIEKAMTIDDAAIRDSLIEDIETAFANNELDYGRKLYLIENCIYGVDIQPIATQISKLRFFISLIVDQKVNRADGNFGVRPLPNLETKFVAANTLIGIEKPDQMDLFDSNDVKALEDKLKAVRHRMFSAKTPATKRKLREEDQALRDKMGDLLIKYGWANETARQLAAWDPYNQNASSPFFDPEWMFGIKDGFDVVIGNPPYVNIENLELNIKTYIFKYYETCKGRTDIYIAFIEIAMKLLKLYGVLCHIIPYPFTNQKYGSLSRKMLINNYFVREILDTSDYYVFETAVVKNIILSVIKCKQKEATLIKVAKSETNFFDNAFSVYNINQNLFLELKDYRFETKNIYQTLQLKTKFWNNSIRLDEICLIAYGARLNHKTEKIGKEHYIHKNFVKEYKPFTEGKNINRYTFSQCGWLNYKPNEHYNSMFPELFENDKIIFINIVKDRLRFAFDKNKFYNSHTVINCIKWDLLKDINYATVKKNLIKENLIKASNYNYFFLLGILNSNIINWYFLNFLSESLHFYPNDAKELPIPNIDISKQKPIIILVNKILTAKQYNPKADTTALETEIDQLVYELYDLTEEEIAIVEGRV